MDNTELTGDDEDWGGAPMRAEAGADGRAGQGPGPAIPAVHGSVGAAALVHLFGQVTTAVVVNVLLAGFVVAALWGHAPPRMLLPWAAAVVVVNVYRLAVLHAYRRAEGADPVTWSRRYLMPMVLSAAVWGLAAPLFAPVVPPIQQLVVLIAIAGISAGALPVNAVFLPAYVIYVVAALGPPAVTYFAFSTYYGFGDRGHLVLGLMTILYGAALTMAARGYNRDLRRAYELSNRLNEANRELQRRASHDALTGLWNRDRFELALDQELDRTARYGSVFALIMLDIDHFKPINDTYGHDTGDRVLRQLGEVLRTEIRAPDQGARWGGEEFMILLPETGLAAAHNTAERLRQRVAAVGFAGPGQITISLGVAACDPAETRSELLKRLDDALYRAKQGGRDRVELATEPGQ